MKNYLVISLYCLFFSASIFAGGRLPDSNPDHQPGGSGVPEPVSVALILGGGAAVYGIKKAIKK